MVHIVLAGGGTAGHTSPLIATAHALIDDYGAQVSCIGTSKGLETRVVPEAGLELRLIEPVPLPRKLSLDLAKVPWRLGKAIAGAATILKQSKADALVGFGGYVSIPAYLAAFAMRIPIVVHEANALPGLANKIGARLATYVATTFPGSPLPNANLIGMPVSTTISNPYITRAEALDFFGFSLERPTLLVSGGSQGAVSINTALAGALDELLGAGINVLHVLGTKNFTDEHVPIDTPTGQYRPCAYVADMVFAYKAADFMLCRAGAGTVVETSMSGVPCMFIPFPHGNGEQAKNATHLVEAGAGILVRDQDLDATRLIDELAWRLNDPDTLAAMSKACRDKTPRDADRTLATATIQATKKAS